jgi:FKBP-type peptidyl-prolyl cis-trans isomerase FkpA
VKLAHAIALLAATAFGCAAADEGGVASTPPLHQAAKQNCAKPPVELLVKDIEPGKGDPVRFRSAVLMAYTGWLYDGCAPDHKGAEFDSSNGRSTPFGFVVGAGRVIKGWDQGVIGMKEGGKRLLVIPPDKGYGQQGAGGKIPPNATLVFEVELVKILQQPAAQ